jgi:peptidoglycan/xylan/chitin deacetylase (PgdA/CDA1 family)
MGLLTCVSFCSYKVSGVYFTCTAQTFCQIAAVMVMAAEVPILMYHSVSEHARPKFKRFMVTPDQLDEHLAYLKNQGYTAITVTEFIDTPRDALPERPVVLTFDDGFGDFYTHAFPLMQKYRIRATLYVTTGYVSGRSEWLVHEDEIDRQMLTWDELTQVCRGGVECGAHSHSHRPLDELDPEELDIEITRPKQILEDRLGGPVHSFAYPFGYYTDEIKRRVREAGYTSACAVKYGLSGPDDDPFALSRLIVTNETTTEDLGVLLAGQGQTFLRIRSIIWRMARRGVAQVQQKL